MMTLIQKLILIPVIATMIAAVELPCNCAIETRTRTDVQQPVMNACCPLCNDQDNRSCTPERHQSNQKCSRSPGIIPAVAGETQQVLPYHDIRHVIDLHPIIRSSAGIHSIATGLTAVEIEQDPIYSRITPRALHCIIQV